MITPMSHYHSAPPSPRVAMTHADAKPAPYIARLQQHVALGLSPAQAMRAIEQADGHMGRVPPQPQPHTGGKGKPRARIPTGDLIMPHMTRDWLAITPELCGKIGVGPDAIRMAMKRLVMSGLIECKRSNGSVPSVWRLV